MENKASRVLIVDDMFANRIILSSLLAELFGKASRYTDILSNLNHRKRTRCLML